MGRVEKEIKEKERRREREQEKTEERQKESSSSVVLKERIEQREGQTDRKKEEK